MLIKYGGGLCRVLEIHHITPGNKRGHVLCKLRDIRTNRLVDNKFRSEEDVERAILDEHEMQFLYRDGDLFHFMNTASYEQVHLSTEVLGDAALYLLPETLINVEFHEDDPVGIHLAPTVDLKSTETASVTLSDEEARRRVTQLPPPLQLLRVELLILACRREGDRPRLGQAERGVGPGVATEQPPAVLVAHARPVVAPAAGLGPDEHRLLGRGTERRPIQPQGRERRGQQQGERPLVAHRSRAPFLASGHRESPSGSGRPRRP